MLRLLERLGYGRYDLTRYRYRYRYRYGGAEKILYIMVYEM